jgi:peptidoglycan/LPS O-acetylase OafA/YrhL
MSTNRTLSDFIDFSRWVSAFLVVLGHAVALLISHPLSTGKVASVFLFASSLGHDAVIFFFVISGFLVGGRMLDQWLTTGPKIVDYFAARASRIYIVLVPALTIGYALDVAGLHYFNEAGLYTDPAQHGIHTLVDASERLNLRTYIGNLLLLQGVSVSSQGSNVPLWSLAYEWWYYCLFGVAVAGILVKGWWRIVCWACLAILLVKLPRELVLWMIIWLMGTMTYFICKTSNVNKSAYAVLFVFIAGIIALCWNTFSDSHALDSGSVLRTFSSDLGVGAVYSLIMIVISRVRFPFPMIAFNRWASGFSYSIYLFHFPVLILLVAMANHFLGVKLLMPLTFGSFGWVMLLIALVYVAGFALAQTTEKYTGALKRKLLEIPKVIPGYSSKI